MSTSWKTTIFGILSALFAFVLFSPDHFPDWVVDLAKFAVVGGLAGLGITAKDWNVSGGKKITAVLLCIGLIGISCSAPVKHPGAVDALDSATYDTLVTAQACLDQAKAEFTAGNLPAQAKGIINIAGRAYDTLRHAWLVYRATASEAERGNLAAGLQAATNDLNALITQLRGLGVRP